MDNHAKKEKDSKNITMHWRNFIIVVIIIFLIGVIIGLLVIPHPSYEKEDYGDRMVAAKIFPENTAPIAETIGFSRI